MKTKFTLAFSFLLAIAIAISFVLSVYIYKSEVFNPKGIIAQKELELIIQTTFLMLIIVIPVLLLTFYVCVKYRASNKNAAYRPEWDMNVFLETLWWGLPFLIVVAISIITWISSHELDPFRPLESDKKPVKIQVVALQWRWLFIYPEEKIASLNFFQFPEKTPIVFDVTADAPMNSFWIPQLAGQIYAMPGMKTMLHIIADEQGEYRGSSANLSGEGFAGMWFIAKATSQDDFYKWVEEAKRSDKLDLAKYNELARPSENHSQQTFLLADDDLYEQIVMKYMMPPHGHQKDVKYADQS